MTTAGAGASGISSDIEFGISGGGSSLGGVAQRTQDAVMAQLKQQVQGSAGWGGATSVLFSGLSPDGKTPFPVLILKAILNALYTAINDISSLEHSAVTLIETVLSDAEAGVEDVLGAFEQLGAGIGKFFAGLLGLLGNPSGANTGTGTSSTGTPGALQTLQQLVPYLGTNTQIPATVLSTLAPGTSSNVQADPGFSANYAAGWVPFGDIQGQGLWYWDGFQGNVVENGSVRTRRTGTEVITVFWLTGTFVPGSYAIQVPDFFREYFLDPDSEALGYYGISGEGLNLGIDHTFFEFVPVAYGGCMFPMKQTIAQGVANLVEMINATPGKFILTGWSQGAHVISNVYDLLRYGKYNDGAGSLTNLALMNRRQDFLAGIAFGNPRRQQGVTFPGFPDPAPGSAGVNTVQLSNTEEDIWWEICLAGDPASTTPLTGPLGYWMRLLWQAIVDDGTSSNGNTIIAAIQDLISSGLAWTALAQIITDPFVIPTVIQAAEDFFQLTTHDSYWDYQPFTAGGDNRGVGEIVCEFIGSFAHLVSPPVTGTRHQLCGNLVAVLPEQVVSASCQVMWSEVVADGPQILLGVNAYDNTGSNGTAGKLIATVTFDGATITNPEPTTNYTWIPLGGDFVMPPGAAWACLVFDVEPEAMTTGIVWFTDASLKVTTLLDSALLDVANMPQLAAAKIAGPQQEADLLTAWQNQLDGIASAASQTNITGADLSKVLSAVGQAALNAQQALSLGVSNSQVLSPSNQPLYNGLGAVGDVTFPQSSFTSGAALPTTSVGAGTSIFGYMNCQQAGAKTFIEFAAKNTGASTGVYVNVYTVDMATGNLTSAWSSADISSTMSTSTLGWVAVDILTADAVNVTVGQLVAVEVVAQGSAVSIASETKGFPNKASIVPPNWGATRTTSGTGGASPASLTQSQLSFGGTVPYILFGLSDGAPIYQAPNQQGFTSNGMYTYSIPAFLKPGDLIDVVGDGAGGGGGNAIVGVNFLGIQFSPTVNGQGAQPGSWATQTLTYGTDIPVEISELIAIVGAGGAPGTAGGDTIVGYGLETPTFDAIGAGAADAGVGVTIDWAHTIGASATALLVPVVVGWHLGAKPLSVQVGGVPLAPLGGIEYYASGFSIDIGYLYLFGLINPPTGPQTIEVSTPGVSGSVAYVAANSVSYTNVSSFGSALTTGAGTTAASQAVLSDGTELVFQAFASLGAALTGYNKAQRYNVGGSANNYPLMFGDATGASGLTFSATAAAAAFGGVAVALKSTLNTVLLTAPGGVPGGNGGAFNPANTNATIDGLGPGNKRFAGRLYPGGATVSTGGWPGNKPGCGGSGGFATLPTGGVGADGSLDFTARQGNSTTNTGIGGGGGGGSELSVTYESTGTGNSNANATSLSWMHNSSGGPSCAVVLFGSVYFSSGSATITCSYGGTSFIYVLDSVNYDDAGGFGLFEFCLGIIGPPSGTQTVTINTTGSTATIDNLVGNTVSYQNVGAFGDFFTNNDESTTLSLSSIPSLAGQMVVAGFAGANDVLNSFNQTSRWAQTDTSTIPMVIGDAAGGSAVSFTAATSAADWWGGCGGVLLPSS